MLLDFVRIINAAQNFKISDKFEFVQFEDMTFEGSDETVALPTPMEVFAEIKVFFDGEPPESYKALNLMIGDWVEKHLDPLTVVIHDKLKGHIDKEYPESDVSDLDNSESTSIWTDQLDYMPRIYDDNIIIEIELVLHAEPLEEKHD
jgi:hypothetical protein